MIAVVFIMSAVTASAVELKGTISLEESGLISKENFNVYSHRGLSVCAPENTPAAFELAGKCGCYGVEFDVYSTKDGEWVISHDPMIDRVTNGTGFISELTLDEILQADVDYGNNVESFPVQKIPTLGQVLDVCVRYSMKPMIEVKGGNGDAYVSLVEKVEEKGLIDDTVFVSFNPVCLKQIKKICPKAQIWITTAFLVDGVEAVCKKAGFDGVSFYKPLSTERGIKSLSKSGLASCAWTVDGLSDAEKLYSQGVTTVISNTFVPCGQSVNDEKSFIDNYRWVIDYIVGLGECIYNKIK